MKFNKSLLSATLLTAASLTAISANAASPATGSFKVNLTVASNCLITAAVGAQDINFGTVDADNITKTAQSALPIKVACSKTTPFNVGLKPSNNDTDGKGKMTDTVSADTIDYTLTADSAGVNAWGDTIGTNTVANTGKGTAVANEFTYTAYATVVDTNVTPGTYSDTVAVTVTY